MERILKCRIQTFSQIFSFLHAWLFFYSITQIYRASHIILDYLQSLTPKYAHNTRKI